MNQEQNAEVWKTVLASTDVPVTDWYNTAHEGCDRWAADPERIAIVFRDEGGTRDVWTYRRLSETSKRLANAFTAAGLRPGDRVGALLTKQPEAYVTALAAWRAGLMYVPMFVGLGNLALVHRGRMAKPKAIVVDASQHAAWALAAKELTDPPVVWTTARGGAGPEIDCWTTLESQSATHETVHTKPTDTATLMFTSGTRDRRRDACSRTACSCACSRSFVFASICGRTISCFRAPIRAGRMAFIRSDS